ncbi:hypothetical protein HZA40_03595, partial [Candidatus Peregrinibacteria bacterium]|nr:hypothetical protein [Candidatus Peregrinibacteria bacterium]
LGIPSNTLDSYIHKASSNGEIVSLKRNHYVPRDFYEKNKTNTAYLFYLANNLLQPSYVSLEAALQYYDLLAEPVDNITSVTLKLPRKFLNRSGKYVYRKINEKLFSDFKNTHGDFNFVIALPHKAVFDYLYYYTNYFTKNFHADLLEELRISTDNFSKEEKKKLNALIGQFTSVKLHL